MLRAFRGKLAPHDVNVIGDPSAEISILETSGVRGERACFLSPDAFDSSEGDMSGKTFLDLFAGKRLRRRLDRALQQGQATLRIVDPCPNDTRQSLVREEANAAGVQFQRGETLAGKPDCFNQWR